MDYYVLKQGRSDGPFSRTDLIDGLANGRYAPEDFAQEEGERYWTPLRRLLDLPSKGPERSAPTDETRPTRDGGLPSLEETASTSDPAPFSAAAISFVGSTRDGAKALLLQYPCEFGIACLIFGTVVLLLSYVKILIVGPILLAALIAGGMTMLRGKVIPGLALCAATIFIPAGIWVIGQYAARVLAH